MTNQSNAPERVESAPSPGADSAPPQMRQEAVEGFSNFSDVRDKMTSTSDTKLNELTITDGNNTLAGNGGNGVGDGGVAGAGTGDGGAGTGDAGTGTGDGGTGDARVQPAAATFNNPDMQGPEVKGPKPEGEERAPSTRDQSNMPVIRPGDMQMKQMLREGQPRREGETAPEFQQRDFTDRSTQLGSADARDSASAQTNENFMSVERGQDGKIASVSSEVDNTGTTFEFNKDGSVTRTTETEQGGETATFGADGKPISRELRDKDGKVTSNEIVPGDSVQIERGENGEPSRITSEQNGITTTLALSADGKPTGRSIEWDNKELVTKFDGNGDAISNELSTRDDQGRVRERTLTGDGFEKSEKLNEKGVVTESDTTTENGSSRLRTLADGSRVTMSETTAGPNAGSKSASVTDAAGNVTYRHAVDAQGNTETFMRNPDGSTLATSVNGDTTRTMQRNADGSWESSETGKNGFTKRLMGKDANDPGVPARDA